MRLATIERRGELVIGVVSGDEVLVPVDSLPSFPSSMRQLIEEADRWRTPLTGLLPAAGTSTPLDHGTLRAPLTNPSKIIACGLTYADHAAEGGVEPPELPVLFAKLPSSIVGPGEAITWDTALTDAVDYEAELAVIIGRRTTAVDEGSALDSVFGYTCLHDVSARDLQFADVQGQWLRAKSLDTFCPIGPWIVTADEIPDPQVLDIRCTVSGEVLQSSSTRHMHFSVARLISTISQAFTLEPGDIIATGTPPGVGYFREPRRLLRHGDEAVVYVERIGELCNPVRLATRTQVPAGV